MEIKLMNKQGQEFKYSDIQQISIDNGISKYRIKGISGTLQIVKDERESIYIQVIENFIAVK